MTSKAPAVPSRTAPPHPWCGSAASLCASCSVRPISVCNAVADDDLGRLMEATVRFAYEEGRTFVAEGDAATHLYNITSGVVRLSKLLPDGRRQIVGFLLPGDLLGLSSNETYAHSAEAITPVEVCRFSRRRLDEMLDEFPALHRRLLGIAASELGAAQAQMVLLGRKTARERIASFLLTLARRAGAVGLATEPLHLPMTRTDIGDYLGLTIETVSRGFSQLKAEGAIALPKPGEVRFLDRRLVEVAAGEPVGAG
jgi:CRP/FNR family transcriptional regulator